MKRGEVWWVNFDPSIGGEIRKTQPAVIVSNDTSNRFLNRLQVIPLTSNVSKVYASEALVTFDGKEGKALGSQIATVSKKRLVNKGGVLSQADMTGVDRAIKIQLALT